MRDPQAVREGLTLDSPAHTIHVGEAGPGGGREERAAAARNDFVCGFVGGGWGMLVFHPEIPPNGGIVTPVSCQSVSEAWGYVQGTPRGDTNVGGGPGEKKIFF